MDKNFTPPDQALGIPNLEAHRSFGNTAPQMKNNPAADGSNPSSPSVTFPPAKEKK